MNRTKRIGSTASTIVVLACSALAHAADVAKTPAAPTTPASPATVASPASPAAPASPASPAAAASPTSPAATTIPATANSSTAIPAARTSAPSGGAETGLAAVYSDRLNGHKTANGERYDRNKLTAAHKTLPFGTQVKVTNAKNQKTVTVRINDRGPTQAGRIHDLSPRAAKALGIRPLGMGEVSAEVVAEGTKRSKN